MADETTETTEETKPKVEDENGNELDWDSLDYETGYTSSETRVTAHHDAIEAVEEVGHYCVRMFYFWDAEPLKIETDDNSDPHIKIVDEDNGVFEYVNVEDEGVTRSYKGADLERIIDVEAVEAKDAYDDTETYFVWHPFTDEELAERAAQKEKAEKQSTFLENGPDQLDTATSDIEDLAITISELVGME